MAKRHVSKSGLCLFKSSYFARYCTVTPSDSPTKRSGTNVEPPITVGAASSATFLPFNFAVLLLITNVKAKAVLAADIVFVFAVQVALTPNGSKIALNGRNVLPFIDCG